MHQGVKQLVDLDMKKFMYIFQLVLYSVSGFNSNAQDKFPKFESFPGNPFNHLQNRIEETRNIYYAGIQLSGYSFHPIYCDSAVIENYDAQIQGLKLDVAIKMKYDGLMRPLETKRYQYISPTFVELTLRQFTYNGHGSIIEIAENSNAKSIFRYNNNNDLIFSGYSILTNQQWVNLYSDSVSITYDQNKPVSKTHFTKDNDTSNYFPYSRHVNLIFNQQNQIKQQFRQEINWDTRRWNNYFDAEGYLEWDMGYPTDHIELGNKPNFKGYLVYLPHNWYEQWPEPTKGEYYRVYGVNFSLGRRLINNGWQNNKLKIIEEYRDNSTGGFDTSHQRVYERDQIGRLVYYQVDEKPRIIGANTTLWPVLAYKWTYDSENRLLSSTLYENMNAQGLWMDSTVIKRTYEFTSDPVPQVFRFTDSLTANGIKRPHLRHTYFYGNFALPVNELAQQPEFDIYPNPANTIINLRGLSSFGSKAEVQIYNAFGQLIMKEELYPDKGNIQTIPLSALPKGIYFVLIEGPNGKGTQRLLIQ